MKRAILEVPEEIKIPAGEILDSLGLFYQITSSSTPGCIEIAITHSKGQEYFLQVAEEHISQLVPAEKNVSLPTSAGNSNIKFLS